MVLSIATNFESGSDKKTRSQWIRIRYKYLDSPGSESEKTDPSGSESDINTRIPLDPNLKKKIPVDLDLTRIRVFNTDLLVRIFKLARHSTGLQALGNTMKANYKVRNLSIYLLF